MQKRILVPVIVLCGFAGGALAQTLEAPGTVPPAAATAPAPEREVVRAPAETGAARPFNPEATGDDKINGLEVPRMKDPRDGGRE